MQLLFSLGAGKQTVLVIFLDQARQAALTLSTAPSKDTRHTLTQTKGTDIDTLLGNGMSTYHFIFRPAFLY